MFLCDLHIFSSIMYMMWLKQSAKRTRTGHELQCTGWKACACLTQPSSLTSSLSRLCCSSLLLPLTTSFVVVIIAMATRSPYLTRNIIKGNNKLSQWMLHLRRTVYFCLVTSFHWFCMQSHYPLNLLCIQSDHTDLQAPQGHSYIIFVTLKCFDVLAFFNEECS